MRYLTRTLTVTSRYNKSIYQFTFFFFLFFFNSNLFKHWKTHAKHRGCESMHIEMVPVLIAALDVTQIALAQ